MKYENIIQGTFLSRPNRFIAIVKIMDKKETVHVKNTGRCKELLIEGAQVYLQKSSNPLRKTQYDLIAVRKDEEIINIDSMVPNLVAEEWLKSAQPFGENALIRREVKHGDSRFDFYIEAKNKKIFLEVKGVTLKENGVALFPDAPTERGTKHLRGLINCTKEGFEGTVLFVLQMKGCEKVLPNNKTDPAFTTALLKAKKAGVHLLAIDCLVTPDSIVADREVLVETI